MAERAQDPEPGPGAEPLDVADTDKIDQAAEPALHPDATGPSPGDELGELIEKTEGNAW